MPQWDIQVENSTTKDSFPLEFELLRPKYALASIALLQIIKNSKEYDAVDGEKATISVESGEMVEISFPKERRYVGFPVVIVPLGPNPDQSRKRVLFIRNTSKNLLYRVLLLGEHATVNVADLSDEQNKLPPLLKGDTPDYGTPDNDEWYDELSEFNKNFKWKPSSNWSVTILHRTEDRDQIGLIYKEEKDG